METWYGSPAPSYVPNHKLMATEQEKSLPSDPKKEGLEAQVSRLAELIGRLENKVRSLSPRLRPSTPLRPQGGQS